MFVEPWCPIKSSFKSKFSFFIFIVLCPRLAINITEYSTFDLSDTPLEKIRSIFKDMAAVKKRKCIGNVLIGQRI